MISPKARSNPPYFLPTEKSIFDIYLNSISKMRKFMFEDLQKSIDAGSNFVVAGALCTYTETWGKLLEGIPEGQSERCFNAFFRRLGACYVKLLDDGRDIYGMVRCGLIHFYGIDGGLSVVNMAKGSCGITFTIDPTRGDRTLLDLMNYPKVGEKCSFNILTYFDDFKKAVDEYIALLQKDLPVQNPSSPEFAGVYPVKNNLHVNLYEVLSHKSIVI